MILSRSVITHRKVPFALVVPGVTAFAVVVAGLVPSPAAASPRPASAPAATTTATTLAPADQNATDATDATDGAGGVWASRVPVPARPAGLPSAIEAPAPYVGKASCDGRTKPGTVRFATLLTSTYRGTTASWRRPCAGGSSEHYEGRAVDWQVSVRNPTQAAQATTLIKWLIGKDVRGQAFGNARRFGVMYIIWNNRIWGSYSPNAWRPLGSCASTPQPSLDSTCHRNHVHFSLSWAGAMGRTSWWTRSVAVQDYGPCRPADLNWASLYWGINRRPCPAYRAVTPAPGVSATGAALVRYSGATVGTGSTGPVVLAVQRALGVPADGAFGPATGRAVSGFRTRHGLRAGTTVDAAAWRALLATYARPRRV